MHQALREQDGRVVLFSWDAAAYVAKRIAGKPRARFKQYLLTSLCRVIFPGHVLGGALIPGDGLFEVSRIRKLAQAGMRVPQVMLQSSEAVVFRHCGNDLNEYLRILPGDQRLRVLKAAVRDLARFHSAGHWHGGAQFRNLLVQGEAGREQFCRIDFEENLEGQFSLPLLQIYDLCLFMMDIMRCVGSDVSGKDSGLKLLTEYQVLHWSKPHQELLARIARLLRPLLMLSPVIRRVRHPEGDRVLALSILLNSVVCSHPSIPDPPKSA